MSKKKTDSARELLARLLGLVEADVRRRASDRHPAYAKRGAAEVRSFERFSPRLWAALDEGDVEMALRMLLDTLAPWIRSQHLDHLRHLMELGELERAAAHQYRQARSSEAKRARSTSEVEEFERRLAKRQHGREPRRDDAAIVRRAMARGNLGEKASSAAVAAEAERLRKRIARRRS